MAKIIRINNIDSPELDIYARLTDRAMLCRQHPEDAFFVAESPMVIDLAIKSGCEPLSFLMEEKHIEGTAKDILSRCGGDVPVYTAPEETLKKLTGFHLTRGVLSALKRPVLPSAEEVCKNARRIAVLENVMNPQNTGAVFRSAAALGMDAVLLTDEGSDPLTRRASRVSMGTVFQVPWAYLPKGLPWQETLHNMGFLTAATVLREDSVNIADPRLRDIEKLAVVIGNEGYGLNDSTIRRCDYAVKIPMFHGVDSLNAAAAAAIAFYQLGVLHRK